MAEVTNHDKGPRGFNIYENGEVAHATLQAGETRDIALVNRNDKMLRHMLSTHAVSIGPENSTDREHRPSEEAQAKSLATALGDSGAVRKLRDDLGKREEAVTNLLGENERLRMESEDMKRRLLALEALALPPTVPAAPAGTLLATAPSTKVK